MDEQIEMCRFSALSNDIRNFIDNLVANSSREEVVVLVNKNSSLSTQQRYSMCVYIYRDHKSYDELDDTDSDNEIECENEHGIVNMTNATPVGLITPTAVRFSNIKCCSK